MDSRHLGPSDREHLLRPAGARNAKRIALTLPDYLARVSVVELAERAALERGDVDVLKFRLKKSLPFDVDDARSRSSGFPATAPTISPA